MRHFGLVMEWQKWHEFSQKMQECAKNGEIEFVIEPYVRFKGEIGEQATMFFYDLDTTN